MSPLLLYLWHDYLQPTTHSSVYSQALNLYV